MKKYIIVTGGVCSSLGKGISASALGSLLESRGLTVQLIKIDPYINVDAGTMSPYQHGEVYVTDDGAETDLDLGNYARFTSSPLSRSNSITTGQIYQEVIQREREGRYLGRTVQVIPHITDRIKHRIYAVGEGQDVDVTIVEIGGTVGDIESYPFIEAARQMVHELGHANVISVHVTLVPVLPGDELKTKPTQHSVKEMRAIGIQPDVLLCRAPHVLDEDMRRKIALFTNVDPDAVISAYDVPTIYQVPLAFHEQGADQLIIDRLGLSCGPAAIAPWEKMVHTLTSAKKKIRIAVVGKYIDLQDSYKSVDEALYHGGIANSTQVELVKLDSEKLEKEADLGKVFAGISGILVPGGFGGRGVLGMIQTAEFARTHGIPYFGICLGMQIMVIEYARNVLGLPDADSSEFAPDCAYPVISLLEDQVDIQNYGGTMRLGSNDSLLNDGTLIRQAYGAEVISERHRHRYEVNNRYRDQLAEAGLIVGATTTDTKLVESVQWPQHSWGVGVQFHPEFKSQPTRPHPLFAGFIAAAVAAKPFKPGSEGAPKPDEGA
ncbi:CTP synthase [Spirochaeta africana]|uniref:CTP synthase n=1 Tax=Spirochaeta africana (strain ATCC 700263 / DSM 8902 / Z-7692) TaxID=889378 RepID=H9UMF8_SPIAZ|nr:CTP synthase [Spirochaeta africana]AFG38701.1 CTP synthase [Spirochaeta africana DSM 8902]